MSRVDPLIEEALIRGTLQEMIPVAGVASLDHRGDVLPDGHGADAKAPDTTDIIGDSINALMGVTHEEMKHWWIDGASEDAQLLVVPTKLMLIVSELAEAMEGHRKGLMDDKLPHRSMLEVELADALIRLLDLAGRLKLDLGGAYTEKMDYNAVRADHKPEARAEANGKKY